MNMRGRFVEIFDLTYEKRIWFEKNKGIKTFEIWNNIINFAYIILMLINIYNYIRYKYDIPTNFFVICMLNFDN